MALFESWRVDFLPSIEDFCFFDDSTTEATTFARLGGGGRAGDGEGGEIDTF